MSSAVTVAGKRQSAFQFRDWLVYFVLALLILLFSVLSNKFFQVENFLGIGRQTAIVSLMAFGMTFVITSGGIDLSVGSMLALSGMASALALRSGFGIVGASIVGILTGLLQGTISGLLIAKLKIPPFLATLGIMSVARGVSLTLTNTKTVVILDKSFTYVWGAGTVLGIPISIIWTLLFFLAAVFLYHYTPFGNFVKAVGGNLTAARYSGVNVDRILVLVYMICGLLAGVAGLLMNSRLGGARPEIGAGMELDVIAAVILGGTSVNGGKGNMLNTLIGSLIMGVIVNGLIILGVPSNIQQIIKGLIILIAVAFSAKSE